MTGMFIMIIGEYTMNEKLNELLNDLEELKEIDGYTIYQSEVNDKDDYVATSCFYEYKELAIRYGIDYKAYGLIENEENSDKCEEYRYAIWDCVGSISWEIKKEIKKQLNEIMEK